MSFSIRVKNEILESKSVRREVRRFWAWGLLLFSRDYGEAKIGAVSENPDVIRLYVQTLREYLGSDVKTAQGERVRGSATSYSARLVEKRDRLRLLALFPRAGFAAAEMSAEQLHAFMAGAYIACGNIGDPAKSYHMEFAVKDEAVANAFAAFLEDVLPGVKITERNGRSIVYYRECAQIEDLLTMMGATRSCLEVIDIEMVKQVRNTANRITNCETANIDKQVNAAGQQMEDIALLLERGVNLSEGLLAAAEHRLAYPDLSLRELAECFSGGISRSGLFHRLSKLSGMAQELRNADRVNCEGGEA